MMEQLFTEDVMDFKVEAQVLVQKYMRKILIQNKMDLYRTLSATPHDDLTDDDLNYIQLLASDKDVQSVLSAATAGNDRYEAMRTDHETHMAKIRAELDRR